MCSLAGAFTRMLTCADEPSPCGEEELFLPCAPAGVAADITRELPLSTLILTDTPL